MPYSTPVQAVKDAIGKIESRLGQDYIAFAIQGIEGQESKFELFSGEKIEPIEIEELKEKLLIK